MLRRRLQQDKSRFPFIPIALKMIKQYDYKWTLHPVMAEEVTAKTNLIPFVD